VIAECHKALLKATEKKKIFVEFQNVTVNAATFIQRIDDLVNLSKMVFNHVKL
jgi:hypothetical protein